MYDDFDAHHFFDDYENISDEDIIHRHIGPDYVSIPPELSSLYEEYQYMSEEFFLSEHNNPEDLEKIELIKEIEEANLKMNEEFNNYYFGDDEN